MNWVDNIKNLIPEYAKDVKLNLDAVINRSSLPQEEALGCALAAAKTVGSSELISAISAEFDNDTEKTAALTAAALMAQNNVWYPFVEMTEDAALKGMPARLRMNAYSTHGGTTKERFESYSLAASIIGKCHFCVKAHYDGLKKMGYSMDQLADIGRIAATITAIVKILA
jgi:lipoyl-dependent peroxiredoxin subunit D